MFGNLTDDEALACLRASDAAVDTLTMFDIRTTREARTTFRDAVAALIVASRAATAPEPWQWADGAAAPPPEKGMVVVVTKEVLVAGAYVPAGERGTVEAVRRNPINGCRVSFGFRRVYWLGTSILLPAPAGEGG